MTWGEEKRLTFHWACFLYILNSVQCAYIIYSIILNKHLQKLFLFKAVEGGEAVIIMDITTMLIFT